MLKIKETTYPLDPGPVKMRIEATALRYTFFATVGSGTEVKIGDFDSAELVKPTVPPSIFTGTHFGLYAMGHNKIGSMTKAWFSDVSWDGIRAGGP